MALLPELYKTHRLSRDVQTFIYAAFSEGILLNRTIDDKVLELFTIVSDIGDPIFGRYDLNRSKRCVRVQQMAKDMVCCKMMKVLP